MRHDTWYPRRPVLAFVLSLSLAAGPDVLIQGEEDPAVVARVVEAKQTLIRACYDQRLAARPELAGNVQVRFEIGSTGAVTSAVVARSTLGDKETEACIVKVLRKLAFAKPKHGTVIVNYPFQLTPSGRPEPASQTVSPRLTERSVSAVLRKERKHFEQCYQDAVDQDPTLRGARVSLVFAIGDEGQAIETALDTTATVPTTVSQCMLASLQVLRFSKPVYGEHAKVTLPFILWGAR